MTGSYRIMSEYKKARIRELTEKGLSTSVIGTRLGLDMRSVYQFQIRHGLRKVMYPRKKGGK